MTLQFQQQLNNNEIQSCLDFILSHFNNQDFLFPRKISTFKSNNKQFLVRTKEELLTSFINSNLVDCKINAYPCLTEYKGIQRYKPNFIFIDLDRNNPHFKTDKTFELSLSNTLKNIKDKLNGYPTVLETGGGYHIYQPVYIPTALENISEFQEFDKPSEQFLRFAKDNLSNGKADKQNNPSFTSCLLRIPGSINSKYNKQVTIVQKWNRYRPSITRELLIDFRRYLIQKKIDADNRRQKIINQRNQNNSSNINSNYYQWIEQLILNSPIEDYRKLVIDLVLAPYLINVRKLSYEESYTSIKNWLDKCNDLKKLDNYRNFEYRISYALKNALNKGIGPMSKDKIKTDPMYTELYKILQNKGALI